MSLTRLFIPFCFCLSFSPLSLALEDFVNIWIDADPVCGAHQSAEVDDCWAIAHALAHPQVHVAGVSTIFGNSSAQASYHHTRQVLEQLTPADELVPTVFPGSQTSFDRSRVFSEAVEALYLRLQTQRLSILALGPLTNIAVLLHHYPQLKNNIDQIITVAGQGDHSGFQLNKRSQQLLFLHNRNIALDPAAAEFVLQQGIAITLIPYELAENNAFNYRFLSSLPLNQNNLRWLIQTSESTVQFWRQAYGINGFFPFDLMAAIFVSNPGSFTCLPVSGQLRRSESLLQRQVWYLTVAHQSELQQSHIRYCHQSQLPLQLALLQSFLPSRSGVQFAESE